MRVQHRAKKLLPIKKPAPIYALEGMERRTLLSVSLPAGWTAHPADFVTSPHIRFAAQGSPTPQGATPAQIVGAYGINTVTFGGITGDGRGQTIGIVDAYDFPTAAADLATFDAAFNLPAPPFFQKLNDQGLTAPLPGTDPSGVGSFNGNWEQEEALDIEWAHAMAPGAGIILFEASNPFNDLFNTTARAAATPGVSVISMSWSGPETSNEASSLDSTFTTPGGHIGVTFIAAAGDYGAYTQGSASLTPQYPDTSPNVISVGGTTLNVSGSNTYGSETAWGNDTNSGLFGGGGGGISAYEPQPSFQSFLASGLSSKFRTYPDVSLEGDPATGVAVADSYDNGTAAPWFAGTIGGTSLATPLFAGMVAIADQGRASKGLGTLNGPTETLPHLYNLPAADFHDITSGSNGYNAAVGYDLASGRGSPVGPLLVNDLASSYIGSHAFYDSNLNGLQDAGETGVAGVVATLMTSGADGIVGTGDDTAVASSTTDAQGFYEFTNIAPAPNYYVHFSPAFGFKVSTQVTNATPGNENLADPLTGNTPQFAVTASTGNYFENVGVYTQTITITSFVSVIRPHSGVAPMVFTVTLAPINLSTVAVPYTTVDGTATVANNDYVPTSGTLVFPPGVTAETITVDAIGNLTIENDVSYTVHITVPPNFVVPPGGTTIGTGLIQNDNFPVATIASPPPQQRSASVDLIYNFTVTLSATAPFSVEVNYTTADYTAVAGTDFATASGTLVFPPGTTSQVIYVTALPGTTRQLDKSFLVQLQPASPATATLGTPSQATGTILTNAPPSISVNNAQVTESLAGNAYLPFTVDVSPSLTGPVTINYATSDGTAKAGIDYVAESGTLTFSPGRVETIVYVPVPQQFIAAQAKTLFLTISMATGNLVIVNATATGTINYLALAALPFFGATAGTPTHLATRALNAVYTDGLGQTVTVSLKGVGSGEVVFLGSSSIDTNAYEILLDANTNVLTSVSVKVARGGQTSITSFLDAGSIGTVNARMLNIVSGFSVAGSANSLNLGYLSGAALNVGGINSGPTVAMNFQRVVNSTISSAIPIRTLTTGAYINTTTSPLLITAPSVGIVRTPGNFDGTIETASLQSLLVTGTIQGGVIATGSIGSVTAAGIVGSTFFAGVAAGITVLPTTPAQFANTSATIGSIQVRGALGNSLIAAWTVNSLRIGRVATMPGAGTFGFSASRFGILQTIAGASQRVIFNPAISTTVDNFAVEIV